MSSQATHLGWEIEIPKHKSKARAKQMFNRSKCNKDGGAGLVKRMLARRACAYCWHKVNITTYRIVLDSVERLGHIACNNRGCYSHSIPDDEHREREELWTTLGQVENSKLLLVVHTYLEISANAANVRNISAWSALKHEQRQYEKEQ